MMGKNCIIRFPDEQSRSDFQVALENLEQALPSEVEVAEFFPDVVVRGVSDQALEQMKRIADPKARFFEDFRHDPFSFHNKQAGPH